MHQTWRIHAKPAEVNWWVGAGGGSEKEYVVPTTRFVPHAWGDLILTSPKQVGWGVAQSPPKHFTIKTKSFATAVQLEATIQRSFPKQVLGSVRIGEDFD